MASVEVSLVLGPIAHGLPPDDSQPDDPFKLSPFQEIVGLLSGHVIRANPLQSARTHRKQKRYKASGARPFGQSVATIGVIIKAA